jgi:glycosyltransferase involved in cell wall biosynthesis
VKIGIVTDAWRPQTNGVVNTLSHTAQCLTVMGHQVSLMTPEGLPTIACPTYPEIRLALFQGRRVRSWIEDSQFDALHIATEGPLGLAANFAARRMGLRFTTSYHTQFPRYLRARMPIPEAATYAGLRWFHGGAVRTMVGTREVRRDLRRHGLRHLALWARGVDTELFRPRTDGAVRDSLGRPRPLLMYMGRVAVEKSVEDFLSARVPGSKIVIGGGPALEELKRRYPDALFMGYRYGTELAGLLAAADVFVFPSRTDTFGLVLLEALACGVPVAAYPVTGPIDVIRDGEVGCLHENLALAINGALKIDRCRCRQYALGFRWENATRQFLRNLEDMRATARATFSLPAANEAKLSGKPLAQPPRLKHG